MFHPKDNSTPFLIVTHSKTVLNIALKKGWLVGARYTNLRDIRTFDKIDFIDIDWRNYKFDKHLNAVKSLRPFLTVAKDIEFDFELHETIEQANRLSEYARHVIIVPKAKSLAEGLEHVIPKKFILGYSVPSKYGGTRIDPKYFKRRVHLLGGRPDVQLKLARQMNVFSLDCNRFTLDAKFGDYFDGEIFRPHKKGGYLNCIEDSIKNITSLWKNENSLIL